MGGGEINQLELITHLDPDRFECTAVVAGDGPYVNALRSAGIETTVIDFACLRIRSRRIPRPASVAELYRHITRMRPNLIHSASLTEDHHSAVAALRAHVPVIHDQQTIVQRALLFDRWRARRSAAIVCISNAIRQSMLRTGMAAPIADVIYSGVDPGIRASIDPFRVRREFGLGRCNVVGMASRLAPGKGHGHFIKAAAMLKDGFPDCRFVVAGSPMYAPPDYESNLHQMAASLGVGDRVVFTGFRPDVLNVIAAMDVFVCASDEEALGRAVLEAMALGKPVIATKAGGVAEIVQDGLTGFLVPPRDPESLASAITACLTDLDAARMMGLRGHERVRALYSIQQNVDRVQYLYQQILAPEHGEHSR